MQRQSIDQAMVTEQMLRAIDKLPMGDEVKLRFFDCAVILGQLAAALAGCGVAHWMTS